MNNIEEKFSARPVGEEKKQPRRIPARRRKITSQENSLDSGKIQRIEKELKAIYEDNSGKIPNMHQIQKRNQHPVLRAIFGILVFGGCMAIIAWVGFFYLPSQKQVGKDHMVFEINGPTELKIGATTTYILRWKNDEGVKVSDAVITANYPDGFAFLESTRLPSNEGKSEWRIGEIATGQSGEIKITGQNFGSLDQQKSWRVFLTYRPDNFQSEMQKMTTLTTRVAESPVSLSISGPEKATAGDEAGYIFTVKNLSDWQAEKLILQPVFPQNFYVTSSSPKIGKDNTWIFNFIATTSTTGTDEYNFKIYGKFIADSAQDEASSTAITSAAVNLPFGPDNRLFNIAQSNFNTEIFKSGLALSLAVNGTMSDFGSHPGDTLNATLHLKNNGKESIKNVVIKIVFDAPALKRQSALDWTALEDPRDGTIVGEQISDKIRRGTITWTSAQLKGLAEIKAGQEANIDFQLPVRDTSNFDLASIGEYAIKAAAEATYNNSGGKEEAIGGNPINITLNSDLRLDIRENKISDNGREISWVLTNNFHPLKDLELTATLFGDVSFESASPTPAGTVNYDEKEKKISWTIPAMPEPVDILALPFTVTLNNVNPTQNTLVSKVRVRATDTVTGQVIEFMGDEVPIKSE